jgi:hypothetical protein
MKFRSLPVLLVSSGMVISLLACPTSPRSVGRSVGPRHQSVSASSDCRAAVLDQGARNVGMADLDTLAAMLLDERPLNLEEPGWIYELKYDGYRLLAEFGRAAAGPGSARAPTRQSGSRRSPEPRPIGGGLYVTRAMCVLDEYDRSDSCRTERVGGAGMTVHGRRHTWSQLADRACTARRRARADRCAWPARRACMPRSSSCVRSRQW